MAREFHRECQPLLDMPLLICMSILFVGGFLTVVTEAFTRFAVVGSLGETLRELALQAALFSLSAVFWALTVWAGLHWLGHPVEPVLLAEILGGAHLPLLIYPLTILPTVGFRLAQLLRLLVYASFAAGLAVFTAVPALTSAAICLPGWLFHFLANEARLVGRHD